MSDKIIAAIITGVFQVIAASVRRPCNGLKKEEGPPHNALLPVTH